VAAVEHDDDDDDDIVVDDDDNDTTGINESEFTDLYVMAVLTVAGNGGCNG